MTGLGFVLGLGGLDLGLGLSNFEMLGKRWWMMLYNIIFYWWYAKSKFRVSLPGPWVWIGTFNRTFISQYMRIFSLNPKPRDLLCATFLQPYTANICWISCVVCVLQILIVQKNLYACDALFKMYNFDTSFLVAQS